MICPKCNRDVLFLPLQGSILRKFIYCPKCGSAFDSERLSSESNDRMSVRMKKRFRWFR